MLTGAGCAVEEQKVKGTRHPNLICTLPGETDSTIVVGAHFDLGARGNGAVDNWSGASLLPSLFENLRTQKRQHTFVLIGFTSEEAGLLGSRFYVGNLGEEQRSKIQAMINLDSLGLSPTKVWLSRSDRGLAVKLSLVAQALKLPLGIVNAEKVATDDGQPFAEAKIPNLSIHSITQQTLPILHSARDKLDAVALNDYYDTYRLVSAYLVYLDAAPAQAAQAPTAP